MDLTTAGIVTGAVGFVIGSSITTIIFLIVIANKKRKLKNEAIKRHEIIGSIGKKCAEIDHAYSEFRIGKIPFESLGAMILEKIEDVSTELNSNSDILDAFYIKNIERFLEDQKSTLMNGVRNSENEERSAVRPIGIIPPVSNIPGGEAAAVSITDADRDSGIHEISAEESQDEAFSVEPADDVDEFHIEEEPAFTPPPQAEPESVPVSQNSADSAFNTQDSQVNINEEADFDFNATTVLSVDELKGAVQKDAASSPISAFPQSQQPVVPQASLEGQSLLSGDEIGSTMFSEPEVAAPVKDEMTPPPPSPAPVQNDTASQQNQPFVDMDATQVFDQSMFQTAGQQQQQFATPNSASQAAPQPTVQHKAPGQFEQPIPEPPVPANESTPSPQPAFPQQSLSAFDVEATQEFHVSDIMQHAQMDKTMSSMASGQDEEIFEINMTGSTPAHEKSKQQNNSDMVSGDDVANQMDNFFGFD